MEIIVAETAGFCFGVKRAVDMVEDALDKYTKVYSFGRIVHNNNVNDKLKEKGLIFTDDINKIEDGNNVIIRAHGITKEEFLLCKEKKLNVVDTTCPNVAHIHDIVSEYSKNGYDIIIIGDELHPEVLGIKSRAKKSFIINEINQIEKIETQKACVVCQTTMNLEKSKVIIEKIKENIPEAVVFNTICMATENRQKELRRVAQIADAMIIIGDKNSANSNRLYEISKEICKNTQFIENIDELCLKKIENSCKIGVTAGASTPKFIIDEVIGALEKYIKTNEGIDL